MAGDYIPWVKGLTRRRGVLVIAAQLKLSRREVAAAVMEVWEWCDDNGDFDFVSRNCHVRNVTTTWIDELVGVTGFGAAMQKAEWVNPTDDGGLVFPSLGRWVGKSAKERLLSVDRKRRERMSVTEMSRFERDKSVSREEKRREEKRIQRKKKKEARPPDGGLVAVSVSEGIGGVFAHYRKYHPRAFPNPTSTMKEWRAISHRLVEGHTVADLCKAIDGCHKTPFNLGKNDRKTEYLDLALIVRDGTHVARFIEADDHPPPDPTDGDLREETRRLFSSKGPIA